MVSFLTLKVCQKRETGDINEVSKLKYTENQLLVNIQKMHGNSNRKYPNKISNFIFHISNFTTASTIFQGVTNTSCRPFTY